MDSGDISPIPGRWDLENVDRFDYPRYKAHSVHYVSPTRDNRYQTAKMKTHGIFSQVNSEIGDIIVATVNADRITELLEPNLKALKKLIEKKKGG